MVIRIMLIDTHLLTSTIYILTTNQWSIDKEEKSKMHSLKVTPGNINVIQVINIYSNNVVINF